ncbi:MAG: hypothetical protein JWQ98_3315 [Chlorobi bacterium]|nr:hypothetical protein [Chlorobiota bacterium]
MIEEDRTDIQRAPHESAARSTGLRFAILFAFLFVITLPFPYHLLPNIGGYLGPITEIEARWAGDHLLHLHGPYTAAVVSDSTGMYIHVVVLLIISAAGALLWSAISRRKNHASALRYLFHAAISYYLSLQLLKYGFDKLFKYQFYLPEPNTLFTPVGHLSRDILYWSSMGSSHAYNVLAGMLEIIPALLLPFRRTRVLGAIGATMVMVHIVMLNFGFDISVKLYSCFLLFLSLVVALPGISRLLDLLAFNRDAAIMPAYPAFSNRRNILLYSFAKALAIVLVVAEALFVYVRAGEFNDDHAPRPFLHGAYAVETFIRNGDTLPALTTDSNRFRRIFIHRRGYFIAQLMNDEMRDYRLDYDLHHDMLILHGNDGSTSTFDYSVFDRDSLLILRGIIGGDSLAIRARRIDLNALPLLQRSFHWTIDDYR